MGHSKTEMWQAGWLTIWSFVMSLHQENDHREGLLPLSPGSCPRHSAYFTVVFGRARHLDLYWTSLHFEQLCAAVHKISELAHLSDVKCKVRFES